MSKKLSVLSIVLVLLLSTLVSSQSLKLSAAINDGEPDLIERWSRQYSKPTTTQAGSYNAVIELDGGFIVTGGKSPATTSTSTSAYIAIEDKDGNRVYNYSMNQNNNSEVYALEKVSGNRYVYANTYNGSQTTIFHSRIAIDEFDLNTQKSTTIKSVSLDFSKSVSITRINQIRIMDSGDIVVAGQTNGLISNLNLGGYDGFIARYDADLNLKWVKQYGSNKNDYLTSLEVVGDEIIAVGYTEGLVANGVVKGGKDAWAIRVNSIGESIWSYQYGTIGDEIINNSLRLPDGTIVLVGSTTGDLTGENRTTSDMYFLKIDALGNQVLQKGFGAVTGHEKANAIAVMKDQLVFVGASNSPSILGKTYDLNKSAMNAGMYGKMDYDLNVIWSEKSGPKGPTNVTPTAEIKDVYISDDTVIMSGTLNGNLTQTTAQNPGVFDAWLMKLQYNKYTVSYNGNNQTSGMPPVDTSSPYLEESTVNVMDANTLEKEGSKFLGWSISPDATIASYKPGETFKIYANTTLYAVWSEAKKVSVVYDGNGESSGTAPVDEKSPYTEGNLVRIQEANDLVRKNYSFIGWNTKRDGNGIGYYPGQVVFGIKDDLYLYAIWKEKPKYQVQYFDNSGSRGNAPIDLLGPYYQDEDAIILGSGTLSKDGYVFKGWSESPQGTGILYQAKDKINVQNDIKLYAIWGNAPILPTTKITYEGNGATGGIIPVDTYAYPTGSSTVVLEKGTMVKEGYEFVGWSTDAQATDAEYKAGSIIRLDGPTTLFAVWKVSDRATFKLTYDLNGGIGNEPIDSRAYEYMDNAIIRNNDGFSHENKIFMGWSVNKNAIFPELLAGSQFTIYDHTTLYAVWKIDISIIRNLEVTYHVNGGSGDVPVDSLKYANNDIITILNPKQLTKEGYVFKGWSTDPNSLAADYLPGTQIEITTNLDLFAIWEIDYQVISNLQVLYFANGGLGILPEDAKLYKANDFVTVLSTTMTKPGYNFKGWSKNIAAQTADYLPGDQFIITEETMLYAVWIQDLNQLRVNKVTYNKGIANGTAPVDNNRYYINETAGILGQGSMYFDGYEFIGWSLSSDAQSVDFIPGDKLTVNENKTLYAVWKLSDEPIDSYTVTYHLNGGNGNLPTDTRRYQNTDKMIILNATIEKSGYQFGGWSTTPIINPYTTFNSVEILQPGQQISMTKNLTLYAVWIIDNESQRTLNVQFDANGAEGLVPTYGAQFYPGEETTLLNQGELLKVDYKFLGWNTDKNASAAQFVAGEKITVNQSMTLYAIWQEDITVQPTLEVMYDANGGVGTVPVESNKYFENDQVTLLSTSLTKEGFDFIGWSKTSGGLDIIYQPGDRIILNETLTLYAIWKPVVVESKYTITYDANGGSLAPIDIQQYVMNATVTILSNTGMQKMDSEFLGWSRDPLATIPEYFPGNQIQITESLVLYAVWTEKQEPVIAPPTITAPKLTVLNMSEVFNPLKDVNAIDVQGNDITESVIYDSNVDTSKSGIYLVTYQVTDSNGLTANAKQVVLVNDGRYVYDQEYILDATDFTTNIYLVDKTDTGMLLDSKATLYRIETAELVNTLLSVSNDGGYTNVAGIYDITIEGMTLSKTIKATVLDVQPIELKYNEFTQIQIGDAFDTKTGLSAIDANGNDVTSQVVITSTVDTSNAGVYVVDYQITDEYNVTVHGKQVVLVNDGTYVVGDQFIISAKDYSIKASEYVSDDTVIKVLAKTSVYDKHTGETIDNALVIDKGGYSNQPSVYQIQFGVSGTLDNQPQISIKATVINDDTGGKETPDNGGEITPDNGGEITPDNGGNTNPDNSNQNNNESNNNTDQTNNQSTNENNIQKQEQALPKTGQSSNILISSIMMIFGFGLVVIKKKN